MRSNRDRAEKLQALPAKLGRTEIILADNGYLSQPNVEHGIAEDIEPGNRTGDALVRCPQHLTCKQRCAAAPTCAPNSATVLRKIAYRSRTPCDMNSCSLGALPINQDPNPTRCWVRRFSCDWEHSAVLEQRYVKTIDT